MHYSALGPLAAASAQMSALFAAQTSALFAAEMRALFAVEMRASVSNSTPRPHQPLGRQGTGNRPGR